MKGRSKQKTKADLVVFLREQLTPDQIEKAIGGKKPSRKSKTPSPKSETELFDLPIELIWETLYNLPPRDALHFCLTHRKAGEICKNNDFWTQKIQRDFGELFDTSSIPTENRLETYKSFWKEAQAKFISCAIEGHLKCVQSLLQLGINPDIQDNREVTALIKASMKGHLDIVRLLLEHDADPNYQNSRGEGKSVALITASRFGNTEIVALLLKHGAKPNSQDVWGNTALMVASMDGHMDIARLLMEHGANPDIRNEDRWTALDWTGGLQRRKLAALLKSFE
uniref:Ankyrin repeat protein n=1 Tax=Pithovirus LCPAC304 TaxID=2506594 RepID=A0A481Z9D0_9VIRU|nr:MAG: ankyrin repeat protein [Pithovirus LCPAC304]